MKYRCYAALLGMIALPPLGLLAALAVGTTPPEATVAPTTEMTSILRPELLVGELIRARRIVAQPELG